jgi:site-specific DNA-cytosine methylase
MDERSALFFKVVDIVDKISPNYVLFENVSRIVTSNAGSDFDRIIETMHHLQYDCQWTTCTASEVGLPQSRKRWFCLCTKRGARRFEIASRCQTTVIPKMPTLHTTRAKDYVSRYFLLGNSIVPAVARMAVERLSKDLAICPKSRRRVHGYSVDGEITAVSIQPQPTEPYSIILCPNQYAPVYKPMSLKHRSRQVLNRLELNQWPTPRATAPRHSNSLTVRNTKDLPTVALFAAEVQGSAQRQPVQGMSVNPCFVEWLMGYPQDYTFVDTDVS